MDVAPNISSASDSIPELQYDETGPGLVSCEEDDGAYGYLENRSPRNGLVSFPRSGNTWTRITFQRLTRIYSGSIYNDKSAPDPLLHIPGTEHVYVIKSHATAVTYPRTRAGGRTYSGGGGGDSFTLDRAVHLVRNPFDCVWSLLNKMETGTFNHSGPIPHTMLDRVPGMFDDWLAHWNMWRRVSLPTFIVRYEDLRRTPFDTFSEVRVPRAYAGMYTC